MEDTGNKTILKEWEMIANICTTVMNRDIGDHMKCSGHHFYMEVGRCDYNNESFLNRKCGYLYNEASLLTKQTLWQYSPVKIIN